MGPVLATCWKQDRLLYFVVAVEPPTSASVSTCCFSKATQESLSQLHLRGPETAEYQ